MAILLLILVISITNFLLGFGLAMQLGYGPEFNWRSLFHRDAHAERKGEHS